MNRLVEPSSHFHHSNHIIYLKKYTSTNLYSHFKRERKEREAKDERDRKKFQKEEMEKELAAVEQGGEAPRRRRTTINKDKPKKLNISVEG